MDLKQNLWEQGNMFYMLGTAQVRGQNEQRTALAVKWWVGMGEGETMYK